MKNSLNLSIGIILLSVIWVTSVSAIELSEKIDLHGYGHMSYLTADKNTFLKADSGGTWDYRDIALLFTANLHERSNAWIQLHNIDGDSRVDWAFVDYTFGNGSTVKLGQIKLPFGFYNDYRDVAYIRPSTLNPFMYQDVSEVIPEAYRGLGYSYQSAIADGSILLEVYGGQIVDFEDRGEAFKTLIGGRVTYSAPMPGLEFMASIYQSGIEQETGESDDIQTLAFSVGYKPDDLDLKFEVANKNVFEETIFSYYGQAAYAINDFWTPYVRYDYITTNKDKSSDPAFYQRSAVLGIGYRINEYFGIRMEHHFNSGYGLAVVSGEVATGTGEKNWSMTAISLNFIF